MVIVKGLVLNFLKDSE